MDVNAARRMATTFMTDPTNPPPPRHRRLRYKQYDLVEVADVIVALICFASANAWLSSQSARHPPGVNAWTLALVAFVASVPLVLRTRFPLTAWAASALTIIGTDV